MPSGTYTLADLRANRFQSVADFGLDTLDPILRADLAAYNRITEEGMMELADVTTDRQRIYGTSVGGDLMEEGDEFDPGVARKPATGGVTVGFPLRKYPFAIGWTSDYFLMATPADVAETVISAQQAFTRTMFRDVKRALFGATNTTFRDRFAVPIVDLAVKALVNADSADIPNGPNGETFTGSSHTHYDFLDGAAPTQAALLSAQTDVMEHGHVSGIRQYINLAAEEAVRGFARFVPYADPRIVYRTSDTPAQTLNIESDGGNRPIGILGAAEIWVKPWVPAGYVFTFAANDPRKPLVYRQHPVQAFRGLRIAARLSDYPLIADQMESYFGVSVWNRTNGHVLYYAGSASAYVAPTFTS